jgi:hypothetical protein
MKTINWFMLFKEIIAVFFWELYKTCKYKMQLLTVKVGGTYIYHWALKG